MSAPLCVCGRPFDAAHGPLDMRTCVQWALGVEPKVLNADGLSTRINNAVAKFDTSQGPDFVMGHYRIVPGEPPHERAQREAKAWARRAERKAKRKRARAARKAGR